MRQCGQRRRKVSAVERLNVASSGDADRPCKPERDGNQPRPSAKRDRNQSRGSAQFALHPPLPRIHVLYQLSTLTLLLLHFRSPRDAQSDRHGTCSEAEGCKTNINSSSLDEFIHSRPRKERIGREGREREFTSPPQLGHFFV